MARGICRQSTLRVEGIQNNRLYRYQENYEESANVMFQNS